MTVPRLGLASRLSLAIAVCVFAGFASLSFWLSSDSAAMLRANTGQDMKREQHQIASMVSLFRATVETQVSKSLNLFLSNLPNSYSLDTTDRIEVGGRSTPTLKSFGRTMNNSFDLPDRYTDHTGDPVTLFARDGDDFVRVTTSLKKANGERAIGTLLDRNSASYHQLMADKPYVGIARLFGTPYITKYKPIHDSNGKVIGAWFLGVDISKPLASLKQQIRNLGRSKSGYAMLIDSSNGQIIAGGPYEGHKLSDLPIADAAPNLAPVLHQHSGAISYRLKGDDTRQRTTYYLAYPAWHWVIASTVVNREIDAGAIALKYRALWVTLIVATLLALAFYALLRAMLGRPLARVVGMAETLAAGDLTQRIETRRTDEIGQLIRAMNGIGEGLSAIVARVRRSVGMLSSGAESIAADTGQLSERSDQAASSLQETSASLEEITATVENTAVGADRARSLSDETAALAHAGGQAMDEARASMQTINQSAEKIGEILGLMDSLAFQTNILALNSSVEAARAGEHGRGFAVVAREVRGLADRTARAAQDIRGLIKQATQNARTGDAQVSRAAEQVTDIQTAVARVQTVVAEISEGAAQQNEGIQQINVAVGELDATTQQNAGMVEASSKAADTIRTQASELEALVAQLRVDDTPNEPAPHAARTAPAPKHTPAPRSATPTPRRAPPEKTTSDDDSDWATF